MQLLAHYSFYVGFLVLFLLFTFWDQALKIAPTLGDRDVAAIIVLIIATLTCHFDSEVKKLSHKKESFHNLTIGDCFRRIAAKKRKGIERLRVYAITTEIILPIVRDTGIRIEHCQLMIHRFNDMNRIKNSNKLNNTVLEIVDKWKSLQSHGQIGQLEVVFYSDIPYNYALICDSDLLIAGCYTPNDDSVHGNDFRQPYLLEANSKSEIEVVSKNIRWFDSYFRYWKESNHLDPQRNRTRPTFTTFKDTREGLGLGSGD